MTTPRVTEIPLRLTPVDRDPFVDGPSREEIRHARGTLARRAELVRDVMRARRDRLPPERTGPLSR